MRETIPEEEQIETATSLVLSIPGTLLLAKPQIREFAFHTQLFENYQRSEKALLGTPQSAG